MDQRAAFELIASEQVISPRVAGEHAVGVSQSDVASAASLHLTDSGQTVQLSGAHRIVYRLGRLQRAAPVVDPRVTRRGRIGPHRATLVAHVLGGTVHQRRLDRQVVVGHVVALGALLHAVLVQQGRHARHVRRGPTGAALGHPCR